MATTIDPRSFEHPYVSTAELCFLFQMRKHGLMKHLAQVGLEPARSPNGEFFTTRRCSQFFAASDVLLHLPPTAHGIFLAWQRGDYSFPPNSDQTKEPPPLSALREAPVGPRGGRLF